MVDRWLPWLDQNRIAFRQLRTLTGQRAGVHAYHEACAAAALRRDRVSVVPEVRVASFWAD